MHGSTEEDPEVLIEGIEVFDGTLELKKLSFARLSGVSLYLENTDELQVIVPQFLFEKNSDCQKVLFQLFYKYSYEVDGFKENVKGDALVFYPLNKASFSVNVKMEDISHFSVILEKKIEQNRLCFKVEVEMIKILNVKILDLPLVRSKFRPEFWYVYTRLNSPLGKTYNGALVKLDPENNNEKEESIINPKKATESSGKGKKVLLVFAVLLCLALVVIFVLWKKDMLYK